MDCNGFLIVKRIDDVRKHKNISRKDIAENCNVSSNSFSNWIARDTIPTADVIIRIANYLDVSVEWLVTGQERISENEYLKLSATEKKLIDNFRSCNEQNQNAILTMSENLKPIAEKNIKDIG